jgi:nucleotide-binding universal stress UspA family protein
MNPQRILLPIDTRKCYLEVFYAANDFARQTQGATVFLLHVVHLNIAAPEKRVYEKLAREAHCHLERLARHCLRPDIASIVRVRFGKPAEEIVAEARDSNIDLIVLPFPPPTLWQRLFAPVVPRTIEGVIRRAACGVFLAGAKSRFNCEAHWGRPVCETGVPLDSPDRTLEAETSPVSMAERAQARQHAEHRVAG